MKATLIDHMGTDLSVVNAARVSFAKKAEWESVSHPSRSAMLDDVNLKNYTWVCSGGNSGYYVRLSDRDTKLINYLARHKHWTPFGHTAITVHVKAPLFVARQLGKHQVGMVWNEVSRRYVTDEPEFYVPEIWRKAADNVKQGSSDEEIDILEYHGTNGKHGVDDPYIQSCEIAVETYIDILLKGGCPEQARMVLPQSMYTEWYWTGNLVSFANMWKLRTDSHTQRETQEVAHQIGDLIEPLFPVSWKALTKG